MITLIYGGSSSGKSAFAENLVCGTEYNNKYYLATMNASDGESKERVNRHRRLRSGKGFITLEHSVDIAKAINDIEKSDDRTGIILLECMSNLVANEMFRDGNINTADYCINKIIKELQELRDSVASVVVVSNNVFEDGQAYDADTKEYLRALGTINQRIADLSQEVYEVVVGIPVKLKG